MADQQKVMVHRTAPSSVTLNDPKPKFQVSHIYAEYLRNSVRYRHSYNKLLIGTYALSNDLE